MLAEVARLARLRLSTTSTSKPALTAAAVLAPVTVLRRSKLGPRQHRPKRRRLATTTAACGRFAAASARAAYTAAADEQHNGARRSVG
jgi:hypothetical protein